MRLYDTATRRLEELPAAARPDPHVLLRPDRLPAHPRRQRAPVRDLDVAQALARAQRLRGDARREHHRHQRQDLRGRAGCEREARRGRERLVRRGHGRPRPRPARRRAEGDRVDPGDRRDDRAARLDAATPTRPAATSTSASRASPTTAGSPGRHGDEEATRNPVRGGRGGGAEGGPARLRALEGAQGGRGHVVGLAVGTRPAGLAHRVLGDGRGAPRAGVRDPRRRARPRLPAPRERGRAVALARARVRAALDAQRDAAARRREDVEVARQHRLAARGARTSGGRETLLVYFLGGHWRKPIDYSDEVLEQAAAQAESFRNVFRGEPGEPAATGTRSRPRSTTTSTRPRRSR